MRMMEMFVKAAEFCDSKREVAMTAGEFMSDSCTFVCVPLVTMARPKDPDRDEFVTATDRLEVDATGNSARQLNPVSDELVMEMETFVTVAALRAEKMSPVDNMVVGEFRSIS